MDVHGLATNEYPDRVRPPQRGKDEWRIGQEKNVLILFGLKSHHPDVSH